MNERKKSASELFKARCDPAMIFDLPEKAFIKMPFFLYTDPAYPDSHGHFQITV